MSALPGRPIALVGARGAGKTTVGRLLATRLARPFVDLDEDVLRGGRRAGETASSVGELLQRVGAVRFRGFEAAALRAVLEPGARVVLATGGGVVEREDNRAWLHRCALTVFLSVPVEVLQRRLRDDPTPRPSLTGADPVDEVPAVLARRAPLYRGVADHVVECGEASAEEVVERVRAALPTGAVRQDPVR